mgnify:CR=1 FL=1
MPPTGYSRLNNAGGAASTVPKQLPKTKAEAVDVLVRALAIEKLQQDDPNASKFYEDTKDGTSSNE